MEERVIESATYDYLPSTMQPSCQTAKQFESAKAHTLKDVTERLEMIKTLARLQGKCLISTNRKRHIRGGMAIKEKYLHKCINNTIQQKCEWYYFMQNILLFIFQ